MQSEDGSGMGTLPGIHLEHPGAEHMPDVLVVLVRLQQCAMAGVECTEESAPEQRL